MDFEKMAEESPKEIMERWLNRAGDHSVAVARALESTRTIIDHLMDKGGGDGQFGLALKAAEITLLAIQTECHLLSTHEKVARLCQAAARRDVEINKQGQGGA